MTDRWLGNFDPNVCMQWVHKVPDNHTQEFCSLVRAAEIGVRVLQMQNGNWWEKFLWELVQWYLL